MDIRASPQLVLACLQGQKTLGGVRFLVLQTCCYQMCKRPNNQNRFGPTSGPDPAPGAQFSLFGPPVIIGLLRNHLILGSRKKGPVGFAFLPPPRLGLADFQSQCGRAGRFFAPSNMPILAVEAAKSQNRWCLFSGPPNQVIYAKDLR